LGGFFVPVGFLGISYFSRCPVFILAERHKETYSKASKGEERDLEDIFRDLSNEANVFSYIVPAFSATPNLKSCIECNGLGS
jgi:hypothetical protein